LAQKKKSGPVRQLAQKKGWSGVAFLAGCPLVPLQLRWSSGEERSGQSYSTQILAREAEFGKTGKTNSIINTDSIKKPTLRGRNNKVDPGEKACEEEISGLWRRGRKANFSFSSWGGPRGREEDRKKEGGPHK